jgi:hypothetical protein
MNRYNLTACILLQLALMSPAFAQALEFEPCPAKTIDVRGSYACMTDYAPLYIYRDKVQKFSHVICQYYRTDRPIYVRSCDYKGWCKVRFDQFDGFVPDTVITQHSEEVRSYYKCWSSRRQDRDWRAQRDWPQNGHSPQNKPLPPQNKDWRQGPDWSANQSRRYDRSYGRE